jgi:prepilin-type processing-associated H-X9-DG protein
MPSDISYMWFGVKELPRERRAGSYLQNTWVLGNGWWSNGAMAVDPWKGYAFNNEEQLEDSSRTPLLGDGVDGWWAAGGGGPSETDPAPSNLFFGTMEGSVPGYGITSFALPRHGSRPLSIPTSHDPKLRLPGAINLAFCDGHAEQVKLERLWSLYWHKDWKTPAKRPGLQ